MRVISGRRDALVLRLREHFSEERGGAAVSRGGGGSEGDDFGVWKVAELKQALRNRGLPVTGRKAELVARLNSAQPAGGSVGYADSDSSETDVEDQGELVAGLSVAELKERLREAGLSRSGTKATLARRLTDHLVSYDSSSSDSDYQEDRPAAKRARGGTAAHAGASDDDASDSSLDDRHFDDLATKTVAELKNMLQHNRQLRSGSKAVLIQRIIACRQYGNLPRCPKCGTATLKETGDPRVLRCPGYYDEDEGFKWCGFRGEVARTPWIEINSAADSYP